MHDKTKQHLATLVASINFCDNSSKLDKWKLSLGQEGWKPSTTFWYMKKTIANKKQM